MMLLTITSNTFADFFKSGGLFMIPLCLALLVGLAAILYQILSLRRGRVVPKKLEHDLAGFSLALTNGQLEMTLAVIHQKKSVLARLAAVALKNRGKSRAEITHAVEAASRQESAHLHSGISVLDVIITVAPLLGLLGTASGLVTIFQGLGETTNHLAIAHGIAEALNTTIFGLTIAVPCVIAHGFFSRRIELLAAHMDRVLAELIIACEATSPKP